MRNCKSPYSGSRQAGVVRLPGVYALLRDPSERLGLRARGGGRPQANACQASRDHEGTERQGRWLRQVLRGWMAYYAVPMSGSAISAFRHHMIERWHGALMRRSQRRRLTWMRMKKIADRHLPFPRILH